MRYEKAVIREPVKLADEMDVKSMAGEHTGGVRHVIAKAIRE
jgi:hypothetical protein